MSEVLSQAEIDALLTAIGCESAPVFVSGYNIHSYDIFTAVLRLIPPSLGRRVITQLAHWDKPLADSLAPTHVPFSSIALLTDKTIQSLLNGVETLIIAQALLGAPENVAKRVVSNLSKRRKVDLVRAAEGISVSSEAEIIIARDAIMAPVYSALLCAQERINWQTKYGRALYDM